MSEKKKGGRPKMLDDLVRVPLPDGGYTEIKIRDRILMVVRGGNFPLTAAKACGVAESTWYAWLKKGKDGDSYFAEFLDQLKNAEGEAEAVAVGRISQAANDPRHWTAAAWFLERKHPERWAQTVKVEQKVQAELEAVLDKLQERLSPEEYARVLAAIVDGEGSEGEAGPPSSH